jgi:hypothetical protein
MKLSIDLPVAGGEPGEAAGDGIDCEKRRKSLNGRGAGVLLSESSEDRA